jgi:hypothetical protein
MGKSKRPTIEFSVDEEQKKDIDNYARVKGFDKASNLARVALFHYMRKNPLTSSRAANSGTPEAAE